MEALLARIHELREMEQDAKRALKKRSKAYDPGNAREIPCTGCVNNAAAGKSEGEYFESTGSKGARCTRYDKGGNICVEVPLVILLLARELTTLRTIDLERASSTASNETTAAIHA